MAEKIKILMSPDYANALFWDEEGCCIGGFDKLYLDTEDDSFTIDLSSIAGLKKWLCDWEYEVDYENWSDAQWKEWWAKGLEFAKAVKALLPVGFDLYYFSVKDTIWKVRPGDPHGGMFDYDKPIIIEQ